MAKTKTPGKKKPEDKAGESQTEDTDSENPEDEEEDEDDVAEENRRINAIVTSRVKREMKGVLASLASLSEKLDGISSSKKTEDTEDTDEETETKPVVEDPKLARKMTKLEKELAEEKAARKKAEEERSAEADRGKKAEMRQAFQTVLTEYGLTSPRLMRAALDQLEQDGVMIRDEEGKIKFKGQDKYGIETNFDPKAGLKAWIAGDGKEFVPAIEAGGSGTGSARGTGNGTTALTAKDIKGMTPQQLASINLERACSGMPPLGEENQ